MYVRPPALSVPDTMIGRHGLEVDTLSSLDSCESDEAELVNATSVDKDNQFNEEVSLDVEVSATPTKGFRAALSPSRQYHLGSDDGGIELSPLPTLFPSGA